ncbi:helix-turn-helix domain-containing protein [Petralouisia muris]|uniref:helix-turn-helix domain-containing protein n=1 Tax=Petralouisia muris TaxID=3032872 RepID=UPI001441E9C5|nr:helix-turn-helix transcriptional regulator [Petralouisia muris]
MSVFGENLQFYRKQKSMTQEQFAEQFDVSRQTISKWEAGITYPEMEKILQLCDFFSCDMDTLLRKNAAELEVFDSQGYENHMEKRRRSISVGVAALIFAPAAYELLEGFGRTPEAFMNTLFFSIIIAAVLILVTAGIQDEIYRKNHSIIGDFYTKEEKDKFAEKFPHRIAAGLGMILIGLLIAMNGAELPMRAGMKEEFYDGIFLFLAALGIGLLVHTGLGKAKYDVAGYNKENLLEEELKKRDPQIGVWCGCIMILATILFFVGGFVFDLWDICWVAFPVGGMFCGMAALILNGKRA